MKSKERRSEVIHFQGMTHAPENELGVVFLFGKVHKLLGFMGIDEIKPGFPDCWAWRRGTRGTHRVWVEFEYRSSGFQIHVKGRQLRGLKPKKGVVVCWEHNWPECEKYAEIIDLRATVEQGPRVWIQNALPEWHGAMDYLPRHATKSRTWTVAPRAKVGDLLLLWRAGKKSVAREYGVPEDLLQSFTDVVQVASAPKKKRNGYIRSAQVRRVAKLRYPLRWGALQEDVVLKSSPFVLAQMQGQWDVTAYWWRLHTLMVKLNPTLRRDARFKAFEPSRLW
jgi:hypothetical protein